MEGSKVAVATGLSVCDGGVADVGLRASVVLVVFICALHGY